MKVESTMAPPPPSAHPWCAGGRESSVVMGGGCNWGARRRDGLQWGEQQLREKWCNPPSSGTSISQLLFCARRHFKQYIAVLRVQCNCLLANTHDLYLGLMNY